MPGQDGRNQAGWGQVWEAGFRMMEIRKLWTLSLEGTSEKGVGHESQTPELRPRELPPGDAGPLAGQIQGLVEARATHLQSGTEDLIQALMEVV